MRINHACKTAVMTKRRVIKATRVLQRAWRAHLAMGRGNGTIGERRARARKQTSAVSEELQALVEDVDIWLL